MANHFFSINRGKAGTSISDFTLATSSTTGDDIELRLADAAGLTRKDVRLALKALGRLIEDQLQTTFPPL